MSTRSVARFILVIVATLVILSLNPRAVPAQTETGAFLFYTGEKEYPPMPEGTAEIVLTTKEQPVSLHPLPLSATLIGDPPATLQISTLSPEQATALTPLGFAFELNSDADTAIQLTLDYSQIPLPFGGSIHERLTLRRVAACSETDSSSGCLDFQSVPVRNDPTNHQLIIDLASPNGRFILSSQAIGSQSNYSLTPFSVVSSYQVDLNSGAFTTGYPIPVPPARAGAAPAINLSYNSGIVDGMHTHKNNQPGSIGIGWNLNTGAITRHLKTCVGISAAPGDHCLTGDNYSIVLNGVSSRLVKESGNIYRLQNDPHWQVEMLTSAETEHPDAQKEYWLVTTPDGTQYRFGGEIVPESGTDQNSVFYTTVYNTGSTCGTTPKRCTLEGEAPTERTPSRCLSSIFSRASE